jgi:hypothetical protein
MLRRLEGILQRHQGAVAEHHPRTAGGRVQFRGRGAMSMADEKSGQLKARIARGFPIDLILQGFDWKQGLAVRSPIQARINYHQGPEKTGRNFVWFLLRHGTSFRKG